ncbi:MAG: NAD(P)H-dependent oxidoreductase [Lautropia sp.]|nr:NAD(P)H-dependent oxidoreductase [Lautropia sp.]
MASILFFNTSNSSQSINGQLLHAAAALLPRHQADFRSVQDFPLPLFGVDLEKQGFPEALTTFFAALDAHDAVVFGCAEHNGHVTAAFKNLFDWATRYPRGEQKIFSGKPVLLLSTSPGARGAQGAAAWLEKMLGYYNADLVGTYSLGNFGTHFSQGQPDEATRQALAQAVGRLDDRLS